jgi:hypothetical protein
LLNFRKNPTGGVSIEMAEPIYNSYLCDKLSKLIFTGALAYKLLFPPSAFKFRFLIVIYVYKNFVMKGGGAIIPTSSWC